MQLRIRFICVIICQILIFSAYANIDQCSEYIDIDAINNADLVMNHSYALTGTGTNMPGTGSGTMAPCTGSGTIGGGCFTQFNEPIESVNIELGSLQPEYPQFELSDVNGNYAFQNQAFDFNYIIHASRDYDVYNGLSTLDVIKIIQIIYEYDTDLSPYSYIAADVNQDQKIDLQDVIELIELLIGIEDEFEGSKSWIFVNDNQQFVNQEDPWPFVSKIDLENVSQDTLENNFIGVKLGDVSGNADPSSLSQARKRNFNSSHIKIEDQIIEKGKSYKIFFDSDINQKILGMQLFLDYQKLKILNVNGEKFDKEFSYQNIQEDKIFMSWFGEKEKDNPHLFSIDIVAMATGKISDFISLHYNWLDSEMYIDDEFETQSIELTFIEPAAGKLDFTVSQNYPNPFADQTRIKFTVPENTLVSLEVMNSEGRILLKRNIEAIEGENIVSLQRDEIQGRGVLQYGLTYRSRYITNSMLIID